MAGLGISTNEIPIIYTFNKLFNKAQAQMFSRSSVRNIPKFKDRAN